MVHWFYSLKMFYLLKQSRGLIYFANYSAIKNLCLATDMRYCSYFLHHSPQIRLYCALHSKGFLKSNDQSRLILLRNKSRGKKNKGKTYDEESSDDEEDNTGDDDEFLKDGEVKNYSFNSLRLDAILKTALSHSRMKIEESFYQNKIRLNGEMVLKKSAHVKPNNELDLIKGPAGNSSHLIVVERVKILKIKEDEELGKFTVKIWKCKNLTIENYKDKNAWRWTAAEE